MSNKPTNKNTKKTNSNLVTIIAVAAVLVLVAGAIALAVIMTREKPVNLNERTAEDQYSYEDFVVSNEETDYVKINVKDYGSLIVKLDPETAPISVAQFKKMVSEKNYTDSTFHRVVKGFMIQGGQVKDKSKKIDTIKGEFSANGVENNLSHTRGVISMARTSVNDSATSQFFIMHKDNSDLDGNYAAFGKLVFGYGALDRIANVQCTVDSRGERSVPTSAITIIDAEFVKLK